VFLALENIVRGASTTARWAMALGFGLVHGFGFSFALRETLQFAGTHLLTSLLSFNIGVELGQVLVLVVLVPALNLFFRYVVAERIGIIVLSAIVAHTAWHWMTERWDALSQFPSPSIDALVVVRTLLVIVGIVAKFLMPGRDPGGFVITTVLGIVGAVLGGFLGRAVGWYGPNDPVGFLMAVLGAIVLLVGYRMVARRPRGA